RDMGISMNRTQVPVQLDANLGTTNAVQEMLAYVSPRIVKLMPAVPARWDHGSVRGLRMCTGTVSFAWNRNEGKFKAELRAEQATDIILVLPESFNHYRLSGGDVEFHASSDNRRIYFVRMAPNQLLTISN